MMENLETDWNNAGTRNYVSYANMKAGSYVRAEISVHSGPPTPVVSRSTLLMRDGRISVFRVRGDSPDIVERVPVRVGVMNRNRAQILSGLADGDEIVRGEAVARLEDGARIARMPAVSAAAPLEAVP